MSTSPGIVVLAVLCASLSAHPAQAEKKTVCTITVNSADEKEAFRRYLPPEKFQFVELVERGRADWLESACRQGVRCDVLVVSGHYDGGNEFFSAETAAREFLPVDEMERASCGGSCSGLFSQLKEVYLFGCNTLNAGANKGVSGEVGRSLIRSGHSRADALRLSRELGARHGESSRDRMRQVFDDVPVIYGFSSVAPLGPTAAPLLQRYLQSGGATEIGNGRPSARLLGGFAGHSMVATSGSFGAGPLSTHRRDVCQFTDDRQSAAQKVDFIHGLLAREMAESRMFLDRIERYTASLSDVERQTPAVTGALQRIATDRPTRDRFLEFARDADQLPVRARMLDLAQDLGWLTAQEKWTEQIHMITAQLERNPVTASDVDQVCALNADHWLDAALPELPSFDASAGGVPRAAILACLGSSEGHARVLRALTSANVEDAEVAQVYLRHRPLGDTQELRAVTTSVARMDGSRAKIRLLEALAPLRLADRQSIDELARLYPVAESSGVQTAIASVLIRADYAMVDRPELAHSLREHRLKSGPGPDVIDALIRRLEAP